MCLHKISKGNVRVAFRHYFCKDMNIEKSVDFCSVIRYNTIIDTIFISETIIRESFLTEVSLFFVKKYVLYGYDLVV